MTEPFTARRRLIRSLVLLFTVVFAGSCDQTIDPPHSAVEIHEAASRPGGAELEAVVLAVTEILGTRDVPLDLPFAKMTPPADDLDLVEIIMSVEDRLDMEIPDAAIVAAAGTDDPARLLKLLTVRKLAAAVRSLRRTPRPGPGNRDED